MSLPLGGNEFLNEDGVKHIWVALVALYPKKMLLRRLLELEMEVGVSIGKDGYRYLDKHPVYPDPQQLQHTQIERYLVQLKEHKQNQLKYNGWLDRLG